MFIVFLFQLVMLGCMLGWALRARRGGKGLFLIASGGLSRWARRKGRAILLVGLTASGLSAGLCLVAPPIPRVQDEFSYLLAADTFANGRLANPPHPLWVHFETFHVNQQPTYTSKYPPAQGLMLGVGQRFAGHPIVGVWISMGLACAAVCWMLQACAPPRWALLGGLLAATHFYTLEWGHKYWGGAVAMMGGALVFGALRRIVRRQHPRDALLLGVGLVVLANSRPYEGLVTSLPAGLLLVWMAATKRLAARVALVRVLLPLLLVLGPAAVAMGYYNRSVSGNSLVLPYQINCAQYEVVPLFLWQDLKPQPDYNHKVLSDFYLEWAIAEYSAQRTLSGFALACGRKLGVYWMFTLGPILTLPLLALPWMLRDGWTRFTLLTCAAVLAAILLGTWFQPHYAAPLVGLVWALVVRGLRHLWLYRWRGRSTGKSLVRGVQLCWVASLAMLFAGTAREGNPDSPDRHWAHGREEVQRGLLQSGGRHLVIVRYGARHSVHQEWVYNGADVDRAAVVWAREISPARSDELLAYFSNRKAWLLEADASPPRLVRYPRPGKREGASRTGP
jgi:hypothetical protein